MKNRISIKIKNEGSGVYLLKRKGRVIYVGRSRHVLCRMAGHRAKSFDEIEIFWMPYADCAKEEYRQSILYGLPARTKYWLDPKLRKMALDGVLALKVDGSFYIPNSDINCISRLTSSAMARYPARRFRRASVNGGIRIWRSK